MFYFLLAAISLASFAAPLGIQEEWSQLSNPLVMSRTFERRFYSLPLKGRVSDGTKMWSGDYWALNKGNIDFRWNARGRLRETPAPTKTEAFRLTPDELAQLSPAEKFDLLNAQYDYPVKAAVRSIALPEARNWEGICHGWAPASMNHNEPTPKTLTSPDGLKIPFGASDIKALLSYYYAYPYYVENVHQVGRRCYGGRTNPDGDCKQDLNAGAFHIVLTNKVGLENQGFIADMDRWEQVWNHPIFAFESRVLSEQRGGRRGAAPGTVRTLRVKSVVTFVDEAANSWETVPRKTGKKDFDYFLELNAEGMIIGGEWVYLARPDFLWLKEAPYAFTGQFYRLRELLDD